MIQLLEGFQLIFNLPSLLAIIIGVFFGTTIGALPGLTSVMAIAVITPFTFSLAPDIGIAMLLGVYVGGIYGGSISAILLRTPGTPASIATSFDGHPLTKKGKAGEALFLALVSSVVGGLFSALILICLAPQVAKIALKFGPWQIFALTLFGVSVIASVSGKSMIKGLLSGFFGLALALVGMDSFTGVLRYNFNIPEMMQGLRLIPVLIGVFAVSEVIGNFVEIFKGTKDELGLNSKIGNMRVSFRELLSYGKTIFRSSIIGTLVGIVPGTGGGIAAFIAYDVAKKRSKRSELFGKGSKEGLCSAEAANNATTGGALIPMMTLGIPGDPTTAVLISAFMIQGMQPGPLMFRDNASTVYMLFAGFFIANILLFFQGVLSIRLFSKVVKVSKKIQAPIIFLLCAIGAYSVANSGLDIIVMVTMGIIGFFLRKNGFPGAPLIIGFILGPMNEEALRSGIATSHGNALADIVSSPIAVSFIALTMITFIAPLIKRMVKEKSFKTKIS